MALPAAQGSWELCRVEKERMKGREAMTSKRLFRVRLSGRVVRCSEPPPNVLRISVVRSGDASCATGKEPPHNSVLN
jgi:hypothetical protein